MKHVIEEQLRGDDEEDEDDDSKQGDDECNLKDSLPISLSPPLPPSPSPSSLEHHSLPLFFSFLSYFFLFL